MEPGDHSEGDAMQGTQVSCSEWDVMGAKALLPLKFLEGSPV